MKAKHGNSVVDTWRISKYYDEDWVIEGFKTRKIYWQKNDSELLCVPQAWSTAVGKLGEYLVYKDKEYQIVSNKTFSKEYVPIEN
ncbi:hypothetical protein [Lactococcus lactis]|uniref:Uncharacterized protein n=1 Tax=Lactococcus lactis TaxID=1358 RepID=A0A552YX98_9LACT|nr:hypothetical protein [Lactococcus lactis]TRW71881.1 hypothetical protein FNJ53_13085 [Lactococcus lactis]